METVAQGAQERENTEIDALENKGFARALKQGNLDLSRTQPVEQYLQLLRKYKLLTASLGVLSPAKLGLGVFFNTIPRVRRANEANDLRRLFKAARLMCANGRVKDKQFRILVCFLSIVKMQAEVELVKSENNILGVKLVEKMVLRQTKLNERKNTAAMTIEELARLLTVLNVVAPECLDKATIMGRASGTVSRNKNMCSGYSSLTYIPSLKKHVANMLARPRWSVFDPVENPQREAVSSVMDKLSGKMSS